MTTHYDSYTNGDGDGDDDDDNDDNNDGDGDANDDDDNDGGDGGNRDGGDGDDDCDDNGDGADGGDGDDDSSPDVSAPPAFSVFMQTHCSKTTKPLGQPLGLAVHGKRATCRWDNPSGLWCTIIAAIDTLP